MRRGCFNESKACFFLVPLTSSSSQWSACWPGTRIFCRGLWAKWMLNMTPCTISWQMVSSQTLQTSFLSTLIFLGSHIYIYIIATLSELFQDEKHLRKIKTKLQWFWSSSWGLRFISDANQGMKKATMECQAQKHKHFDTLTASRLHQELVHTNTIYIIYLSGLQTHMALMFAGAPRRWRWWTRSSRCLNPGFHYSCALLLTTFSWVSGVEPSCRNALKFEKKDTPGNGEHPGAAAKRKAKMSKGNDGNGEAPKKRKKWWAWMFMCNSFRVLQDFDTVACGEPVKKKQARTCLHSVMRNTYTYIYVI